MENITNNDSSKRWGANKKSKPAEARFKLSITFKTDRRPTLPYWSYDYTKQTQNGQVFRLHNENLGYDKLNACLQAMEPWRYCKASMFFADDDKMKTDGTGDHNHWLWTYYPKGNRIGPNIERALYPIFENGILQIAKTLAPLSSHKFKDSPQGILLID